MGFNFWSKKPANIFTEFATKSLAESTSLFLSALAVGITHLSPLGLIIGEGAKGMMDALFSKSSQIGKKIDQMLREPLQSGIRFLHEGMLFPIQDENTKQARDGLLHEAHVSLTKASMLVGDSYEDLLFIRFLDLLAVCAHSMYCLNADAQLARMALDLQDQRSKVETLEEFTAEQIEFSEAYERFLDRDSYRDKPNGYPEQKLYGKFVRNYTIKVQKESREAREKLNILVDMYGLTARFREINQKRIG